MSASTMQSFAFEKIVPFINSMCTGDTLKNKATLITAVGLFAANAVSLSKAAELANKSIWEFIEILKNCQLPWGEYSEESAALDDATIHQLASEDSVKRYEADMPTIEELAKIAIENQPNILEQDLKDGAPLCYYDEGRRFVIRYPDGFIEYHDAPCLPNKEHCRRV